MGAARGLIEAEYSYIGMQNHLIPANQTLAIGRYSAKVVTRLASPPHPAPSNQ